MPGNASGCCAWTAPNEFGPFGKAIHWRASVRALLPVHPRTRGGFRYEAHDPAGSRDRGPTGGNEGGGVVLLDNRRSGEPIAADERLAGDDAGLDPDRLVGESDHTTAAGSHASEARTAGAGAARR